MSAFEKWFQREFAEHPDSGAEYLYNCCVLGGQESVVWDWLGKTGHKTYTKETFVKAAHLILELKDEK